MHCAVHGSCLSCNNTGQSFYEYHIPGAGSFGGGFDGGRNHGGFERGERPEGEVSGGFERGERPEGEWSNGVPQKGFQGEFPNKELPEKSDIEV